jgi:hypothetical protein
MATDTTTMLDKLLAVNEVLEELRHNLRISPDGAVNLDYITERLEHALEGNK